MNVRKQVLLLFTNSIMYTFKFYFKPLNFISTGQCGKEKQDLTIRTSCVLMEPKR